MQISKDKIVEMIKSRGDDEQADRANSELPDQVDTDKDKGLLDEFGVDPNNLGGLGDKLGL